MESLLLVSIAGILASVPFVPPWDAGRMRAYAAVLPIIALVPAYGAAMLATRFAFLVASHPDEDEPLLSVIGAVIGFLVVPAPLLLVVMTRSVSPPAVRAECKAVRIQPGSLLHILPDNAPIRAVPRDLHISTFRRGLKGLNRPEISAELMRIDPGSVLVHGVEAGSSKPIILIASASQMPPLPATIEACGSLTDTAANKRFGFYYAKTIAALPERR
jgi:hypothetical protein